MDKKLTGAKLIQNFMSTYDINYVFGNPGTTETTFLSALADTDVTYMLSVHESSAVGIAAGYALITGKPSIVNLHTFPGLANGMFNMRNALLSGIPLFIINGTQDSRFLIHNPPLGSPNTQLAETASKYQYEVRTVDELTVALQRCYLQAVLQPPGPVFLSIPMDFMKNSTDKITLKRTTIYDDSMSQSIDKVASVLTEVPAGKLIIVADYAVGWDKSIAAISELATILHADIYQAPFHVQGVVDTMHPNYKGQLPSTTGDIRKILSTYDTMLLVGEKLDAFTYSDTYAMPPELKIIQISAATNQLGFDWPVDVAVVGDIQATLHGLNNILSLDKNSDKVPRGKPDIKALDDAYPYAGEHASNALILGILKKLDCETHVITEGSSEDPIVQKMANSLGIRNVHFNPRGGGLGWAMPLATGIALGTGEHAVCFVGDGGSMFSIHSIWTAAAYKIPVIFVCFINHEYHLLKKLWVEQLGGAMESTTFVGMDISDPNLDMEAIARGFGAHVSQINAPDDIDPVLKDAFNLQGPSFILINREH
jgi:benzoylformate decarboxylase